MTSISVALATCNGARFLGEQLESLARQTLQPLELVVGDDRSSDGTVLLLEAFARESPFPVQVEINEERLGPGDNFLATAARCRGDAIAFCDQDDVWLPRKLERCANALDPPEVRLVIHACSVVDEALCPLGQVVPTRVPHTAEPLEPPRWGQAPGMAMVFDRSLLSLLPWDKRPAAHHRHARLLHDEWIYGLGRLAGRTVFVDEPLALYRQHDVNVEGTPERGAAEKLVRAVTVGRDYYARRAAQAHDWARLLREGRFAAEGEAWDRLGEALELRASVYAGSRAARIRRLRHAVKAGVYRDRGREGFGLRGLTRDGIMILLGR